MCAVGYSSSNDDDDGDDDDDDGRFYGALSVAKSKAQCVQKDVKKVYKYS